MFGARRRHDKQDERDAEDFVHRLAEVREDLASRPPTIVDVSELETHLRHVDVGTHLPPRWPAFENDEQGGRNRT